MTVLCVPEAVICRIFSCVYCGRETGESVPIREYRLSNDSQKEVVNSEKQPKRFYSNIYMKKFSKTSAHIKRNLRTPSN
jgi:hypothetical protein